jgi:hypothetical protein
MSDSLGVKNKVNNTSDGEVDVAEETRGEVESGRTSCQLEEKNKKGPGESSNKDSQAPWWPLAIAMLLDFENKPQQKDIAKACGVSKSHFSSVKCHNKEFKKAYAQATEELLLDSKPEIDQALMKKAKTGDVSAIRLYYERAENMQNRIRTDWNIEFDIV